MASSESIISLRGNVKFSVVTDNSTYAIFMHPDLLSSVLIRQADGGFAVMYFMNECQSIIPKLDSFREAFESMVTTIESEVRHAIESPYT